MGLFNFLKHNNTTPQPEQPTAPEAPSAWDNLGQAVPFNEASGDTTPLQPEQSSQPETPAEHIKRQGDKLIAAYLYDPTYLTQKAVTIRDEDRAQFYEDLQSGALDPVAQSHLLQNIGLPSGSPEHPNTQPVMDKLAEDRHLMKILAYTGGLGADTTNNIRPGMPVTEQFNTTLRTLLQRYPTPIEFAAREEYMMNSLERAGNSPAKLAEYEDSFETFKETVYGKRYEYFKALGVLRDQALQYSLAKQAEADRPRREAELRQLQTPVSLPDQDSPYAPPEAKPGE